MVGTPPAVGGVGGRGNYFVMLWRFVLCPDQSVYYYTVVSGCFHSTKFEIVEESRCRKVVIDPHLNRFVLYPIYCATNWFSMLVALLLAYVLRVMSNCEELREEKVQKQEDCFIPCITLELLQRKKCYNVMLEGGFSNRIQMSDDWHRRSPAVC